MQLNEETQFFHLKLVGVIANSHGAFVGQRLLSSARSPLRRSDVRCGAMQKHTPFSGIEASPFRMESQVMFRSCVDKRPNFM